MSSDPIYLGSWVDQSAGTVLGSTLTTTSRTGNLIIAFLALFVSAAGSACWGILRFTFHQSRSTTESRDGLHHQQQAILANSTSATKALTHLAYLPWIWRSSSKRPYKRSILPLLIAMLVVSVFAVAGLFSSRVISASNFVLVSGKNCGIWNYNLTGQDALSSFSINSTRDLAFQANFVHGRDLSLSSLHYARSCYIGGLESNPASGTCDYYPASAINWTASSGPCPFDSSICAESGNGSVVFDTALDSSKDLGFNTKPEDRITYHRRLVCSPLNTTRYQNPCVNETLNWGTDCVTSYNLSDDPRGAANSTPQASSALKDVISGWEMPYILGIGYHSSDFPDGSTWNPIPQLNRSDADVSMFSLANGATYNSPVSDPWFFSQTAMRDETGNINGYISDEPLAFLACTEQYQVCTSAGECSPQTGYYGLQDTSTLPIFNDVQQSMIGLLYNADEQIGSTVTQLGIDGLRAVDVCVGSHSLALPDDQWKTEISFWWAVTMASLQQVLVEQATGPTDPAYQQYMVKPTEDQGSLLCSLQKVRRSDYDSFSFLGITLILVVGSIFIVTDLFLASVVGHFQRGRAAANQKRLEWIQNGFLQLQRLAYQRGGMGTWTGEEDSVPLTQKNEKLGLVNSNASSARNTSKQGSTYITVVEKVDAPSLARNPESISSQASVSDYIDDTALGYSEDDQVISASRSNTSHGQQFQDKSRFAPAGEALERLPPIPRSRTASWDMIDPHGRNFSAF